jgi:hypothetical protein
VSVTVEAFHGLLVGLTAALTSGNELYIISDTLLECSLMLRMHQVRVNSVARSTAVAAAGRTAQLLLGPQIPETVSLPERPSLLALLLHTVDWWPAPVSKVNR